MGRSICPAYLIATRAITTPQQQQQEQRQPLIELSVCNVPRSRACVRACVCRCPLCVCVDCAAAAPAALPYVPAIERICKKKCNDTPAQEAEPQQQQQVLISEPPDVFINSPVALRSRRTRPIVPESRVGTLERWNNCGTVEACIARGHGLSPSRTTATTITTTFACGQLSCRPAPDHHTRARLLLRLLLLCWRVTHRVVFRFVCNFCTMRLTLTSLRWLRRRRC